jgi:hypothetical protein
LAFPLNFSALNKAIHFLLARSLRYKLEAIPAIASNCFAEKAVKVVIWIIVNKMEKNYGISPHAVIMLRRPQGGKIASKPSLLR